MADAAAPDAVEDDAAGSDELRSGLVARLTELHPDGVVGSHVIPGRDVWVRVRPEAWVATLESLRYVMGARYFSFLSAIDWLPSPYGRYLDAEVDKILTPPEAKPPVEMTSGYAGGDTRFQVVARVTNLSQHWGITVKADCAGTDEAPSIHSICGVFAGADWHEREAWEMFGIDFVGHPHLRHIYLPSDFEGYPLRKDFPLIARIVKPWPGIVDIEQMPVADEAEGSAGDAQPSEEETSGEGGVT